MPGITDHDPGISDHDAGIGDHDPGIGDHVKSESVITMVRNTHLFRFVFVTVEVKACCEIYRRTADSADWNEHAVADRVLGGVLVNRLTEELAHEIVGVVICQSNTLINLS